MNDDNETYKLPFMNNNEFDPQELFEAFLNHSPVVAFMKDEAGRYVYANERMANMFRFSFDQLKGKTDLSYLPEDVAESIGKNDRLVLSTGQTVETMETVPTPDNISRHWMVIKFPFTNAKKRKFVCGVAIDVTKQKEDEEKLRRSEQHYRHLIENSQGFICTHDREGVLLSVNPAAAHSLGYEPSEIIGKNLRELINHKYHPHFDRQIEIVWRDAADDGLMILQTKDGRERTWRYHNVKLVETVEKPFILGYAQDVTEMQETQKQLKSLTLSDDLTGLYNRRGFMALAERQLRINRSRRSEKGDYLIFADMDGLKQINDRFGHNQGSLAITKMSELLAGNFRASDIIARLGGDEFVILITNADDASKEIVINRLQTKIDGYNEQKLHPFDLSLSIGVLSIDADRTESIEQLLVEADEAMYAQKRKKKPTR